MIPKIIHYCWFGNNALPVQAEKCIASWRRFFPDYEIRRCDESNFDINAVTYVRQAYEAGKYAFVSDYARFKLLYDEGGLYFDTDVEVIRSFDDIINAGAFMGCERTFYSRRADPIISIAPGLCIGAPKRMPLLAEILNIYDHMTFADGENVKTVVDITTNLMRAKGWKPSDGVTRIAGMNIYPPCYFSPKDTHTSNINIRPETRSIHHFAGSWLPETDRRILALTSRLGWLPGSVRRPVAKIIVLCRCKGVTAMFRECMAIVRQTHNKSTK